MSERYLPSTLRRTLERVIKDARIVAEEAARDAIRRLGVAEGKAPSYLSEEEKELRRRLRAHARALGDAFDRTNDTQKTKHLIEATAYAHWHRMLFARFLAERGLLRNPEYDAPVTLEDCRELAEAEGLTDPWTIAERYAAQMLPAVFRVDDPVLALEIDPVHTQKLQKLVTGLDADVFEAEDSLGWTYQFWRAAEKDAVNASGVKIGADELPAVTQLFTEPYMVRFLLHNTLGAWWAGKVLASNATLAETAADEDELRAACSLPDYSFDMLRFVRDSEDGPWRPAAGTFPDWPSDAKNITVLDPCCGSGHFLTEALAILTALRQAEEGLSLPHAVSAALSENLHGLEIDGRCVQIAAFAVALAAWRIGGWQTLPLPHIAWAGSPPPLSLKEFTALSDGDRELEYALGALHELFANAPVLGSLIQPTGGDLFQAEKMQKIERLLDELLVRARRAEPNYLEGMISARGMTDTLLNLRKKYHLLATNVPFLTEIKFSKQLLEIRDQFPNSRANLATCLIEKMLRMASISGVVAAVSPQSWWYQKRYERFRTEVVKRNSPILFCRLGANAFEDASSNGENVGLSIISRNLESSTSVALIDASNGNSPQEKNLISKSGHVEIRDVDAVFVGSQSIVAFEDISEMTPISGYCSALLGISTSDSPRFTGKFWEVSISEGNWEFMQTTPTGVTDYSGLTDVVFWEKESGSLAALAYEMRDKNHNVQNWRRGKPNWGKRGVVVSQTGSFPASIYTGSIYDSNCCAIIPKDQRDIRALWAFCSSGDFAKAVKSINTKWKVEVGTFLATHFDHRYWTEVSEAEFREGLPAPQSNDPTQWIYHGHPADTVLGTTLHVVLARLCGYLWPAETDVDMALSDEAREWIKRASVLPQGDNDGLLGVPAVAGEKPLADRLRTYLAATFGAEWSDELERRLVAEADETLDKKAARDGSLEAWVRDRAFRQHCALFAQRPFIWHISDGLKDGFSVFVHYHRFEQANLRKLTYTLLGDWLARAKAEGNTLRYEKGRELQQKLEAILEGEKPYDIFVRWKPLAQQPLGWDPDLDDGVRQNIRPFILAGVLTHKLDKILKDKDRGKDVPSAPWYDVFKGERRNDHHTTLAEKRAAREAAARCVEASR